MLLSTPTVQAFWPESSAVDMVVVSTAHTDHAAIDDSDVETTAVAAQHTSGLDPMYPVGIDPGFEYVVPAHRPVLARVERMCFPVNVCRS